MRQFAPLTLLALGCVITPVRLDAVVPTPKEHFGYEMGTEKKLATYEEIAEYFKKLEKSSDRLILRQFGSTTMGKPMYLAIISSPENLKKLDYYKDINRRLALGLGTVDESRKLAQQGKAFVWIDSGIHASETAPPQHSPDLAYKMLTDESDETKRIRDKVILIQILNINPDGADWVIEWYRSNLGTPYETAPLPRLYHRYAGHDNNRDWYMLNLPETRYVTRQLFQEWYPQIVYNQHQAPPYPARIFVPPYAEPLNPNIPATVMEGINLIGAAMKERFARENKPGILSYWGFDAWWNGGLRSVPAFHNSHGILTETAGWGYGTVRTVKESELPDRFGNGIPTKEPSVFYEAPWLGGTWGVRNAVDYMLTADWAILDLAATRSYAFLTKAYDMARTNIESKKGAFAYVVAMNQADATSAREMLNRLSMAGISVKRAAAAFTVEGTTYPEGTIVMPAGQAFRSYLVDLMEPQKYPEIRTGTTGPTKRPYDVAGYTLPMLMGVKVDRVMQPFEAKLEDAVDIPLGAPSKDHKDNSSYVFTAAALKRGEKVRWAKDGTILAAGDTGFDGAAWELQNPRVAVYEPFTNNMDAGWTDWMLDYYKVEHKMIQNKEVQAGGLRAKYDTIILASQSMTSIMNGIRSGERSSRVREDMQAGQQRPEFTGGIELEGLSELHRFVLDGGTLVTFDAAAEVPVTMFPLPARLLLKNQDEGPVREEAASSTAYYCPGSVIRITVDNTNPLAFGMPAEAYAYSQGGQAFEVTLLDQFNSGERETRAVASYAKRDLLASGWISGERAVLGRPILVDARHGKGHVVMFGFRPQFRGQTFGTFKFVLNAIYLGSAKAL